MFRYMLIAAIFLHSFYIVVSYLGRALCHRLTETPWRLFGKIRDRFKGKVFFGNHYVLGKKNLQNLFFRDHCFWDEKLIIPGQIQSCKFSLSLFDQVSFQSTVVSIKCRFNQLLFRSSVISIKCRSINCHFDQVWFRITVLSIKCRSIKCRFDQLSFQSSVISIKCRFDQLSFDHVSFRLSVVSIKCRSIKCRFDQVSFP